MLGFQLFETEAITISGIELAEKISETSVQIRKASRQSQNRSRGLGGYLGWLTYSLVLYTRVRSFGKVCTRAIESNFW